MATKITSDVLESYLHCKVKGHLKLAGQQGTKGDFETMLTELRAEVRFKAIEAIIARHPGDQVARNIPLTTAGLKRGPQYILDGTFEDEALALHLDGLKRTEGESKLGDFHYQPVLFHESRQVKKEQKRLLEVSGMLLGGLQGRAPAYGVVWHGRECKATRVKLNPDHRKTQQVLRGLMDLATSGLPPRLLLNDHCSVCEFRQRCRTQAEEADAISLLRGIGEKEIKSLGRKGILTLTQLAHTFRPRRKGKRAVQRANGRYHALQALAIRDKRVYVFGTPKLIGTPSRIYLDMEGKPDEGFVYLIGMVVIRDGQETHFSFWADSRAQEHEMFEQFLAEMSRYEDFAIFCYGGYEKAFLKRMRKVTTSKQQVDRVLDSLVNVLSVVYAHLYFPCYSNSLKEIASGLGGAWSEPDASGLLSLVWRARWEATKDEGWKRKLLTYNLEDCAALKKVTEFIDAIHLGATPSTEAGPAKEKGPPVARVEELDQLGTVTRRGKIEFFHPDYELINKCAHFDYQRRRVYARTSKILRKSRTRTRTCLNRTVRISQKILVVDQSCPACGGVEVIQWERGKKGTGLSTRQKRAFDLVFTSGGIKRKVIECRTSVHECRGCGKIFIPDRYERLAKHFHGLLSWVTYQQVAHRITPNTLKEMLKDFFRLAVCQQEINEFKSIMAQSYQPCYDRLLAKILSGKVLHIDETQVRLRTSKGYVWVLTTTEEVVYMYRPTREGDFLPELLKNFHGVLVSDFYAAYDAINCPQQKCLIHLMRDMNQELLNNPFDTELQSITGPFGILLRAIVSDIDRYGLRRSHLNKHEGSVAGYFESIATRVFRSEAAEALRVRLVKNRDKLFTFIAHDGVAWNNNNAENAIRQFAYYREESAGLLSEAGLKDYLVLLSTCQTCRYKGISFLKFLLSKEQDLDAFCQGHQQRRQLPLLETYPAGVVRPDFGGCNRGTTKPKPGEERMPASTDESPRMPEGSAASGAE
jgi:predicted RecB family nuclease